MKNKLAVEFVASEKLQNIENERRTPKTSGRRESTTPKIIVCPPMEDINERVSAPRGGRLLRALGRRLPRRSTDESSDSSSSESASDNNRGDDRSSCSVSDSGSDGSERRRHRSTVSLRRVFQSLNLTSRSSSCSPAERSRQPKKQQQPKRILRTPVTYTYVRGLSGLPTQRVPRHVVYCPASGLHR